MCRLAVITPVIWSVRINRLIEHLQQENIVQFKTCCGWYRDVDPKKVSHFSTEFTKSLLNTLFHVELLVGLEDYEMAADMLTEVHKRVMESV
jgi:hypothetical protein